jgi:hypothetical protein
MLIYIFYGIFTIYGLCLIQSSVRTKSYEPLLKPYKKFKLYSNISLVGLKTLSKYSYIKFLQYLNSNVKKIDKNTYELTYIINENVYKMIVSPKRGPSPVLQIIDHNMNDVTEEILPYLGPNYDWHGKKFSIDFFNKESLTFEMTDGSTKKYSIDKHIHIE